MSRHWSSRKILSWTKVRRGLGVQVAGVAVAISLTSFPIHAFDYEKSPDVVMPTQTEQVSITTHSTFAFPLEQTLGMSQGFHALHPGVDLRAPKGTPVLAMADGTVIEVEQIWGGYGHYIRIAHQGTLSTLYAHLDKVAIKVGQKVVAGEQIGTVGLTGWTTGPHLHFEVHQGESAVNPLGYISVNQ